MNDENEIAEALYSISAQLKKLGLADACTPFGAVEALIVQNKEDSQRLADSIEYVGACLLDSAAMIAKALAERG